MKLIVLAGIFRQFENWCLNQRKSPRDHNLICPSDEHQLRGLHGIPHIIIGTFWDRNDAEIVWQYAKYAEIE